MPEVTINFWAVIGATIIPMVVGMAWYSPTLFGVHWMNLIGKTMEDLKGSSKGYALSFIGSLILSYILAHFVQYAGAHTLMDGLKLGFWVWLGFVATTTAPDYVFAGRPLKLYLINVGYQLVSLLGMSVLLALWR